VPEKKQDPEWRTVSGVEIKGKIVSVRVFELLGRKAAPA
jgi:hypothetical protein